MANSVPSDCLGMDGTMLDASNLDSDGSCGDAVQSTSINLGPLQDNGPSPTGSGTSSGQATWPHALLDGSAARDAGDNATCAAIPVNNVDQRGIPRPQFGTCDIGAFEFWINAAPTITSSNAVTVAENQTSTIDVQAIDDIDAEGAGLIFSLSGTTDDALFAIDANTGAVTFISAPDFENPSDVGADNAYNVQVTVTDTTFLTGTLAGVQDIVITVTDVYENVGPTITSGSTITVAENQTGALDVQAADDVDAEGAGLIFSLSGGADDALFTIDANTGVVTFISAPDFENPSDVGGDNRYNIQVTVTDSGSLTAVQDIVITVADVAENVAPIVTSSGTITVAENQTSALDVQAIDDSDAEGSGLTFHLSGGADQALFVIDANTGVVRFVSTPDFESPTDVGGR
ncbi:cadherin repeat domain-containing protein [Chloroflexi bacterium TSY]|nr:cadherin repeat domain-containing protein [Chloroflexi bacterium TSY]